MSKNVLNVQVGSVKMCVEFFLLDDASKSVFKMVISAFAQQPKGSSKLKQKNLKLSENYFALKVSWQAKLRNFALENLREARNPLSSNIQ